MEKRYTLSECYELLDVNPKTFRKWLELAGLKDQVMREQISKADERVKYLTQKQLEMIAKDHERVISTETPQDAPIFGSYKLLVDRIDELQALSQTIQKEIQATHLVSEKHSTDLLQLQETFTALQSAHTHLAYQIATLHTTYEHTVETLQQIQHTLTSQQERHEQYMEQMGSGLTDITARLTSETQALRDVITTNNEQSSAQHQEHNREIQLLQSGIQQNLDNHIALATQVEHTLSEHQQNHTALATLVEDQQHAIVVTSESLTRQSEVHDKNIQDVRATLDATTKELRHDVQVLDQDLAKDVANLSEQLEATNGIIDHQRQLSNAQQIIITQLLADLDREREAREDLSKQVLVLAAAKPSTRQSRKAATTKKPE